MHMHQASVAGLCVCTALRKASRAMSRVYDEALASHGLSTAQFAILRHVARAEPVALSRLAEQLVMDRTSLYRAVAPLEAKGWLAVEAGSGRSRLARLTAAGRDVMESAEADWEAVQGKVVDALGTQQWAALRASLADVVALSGAGAPSA